MTEIRKAVSTTFSLLLSIYIENPKGKKPSLKLILVIKVMIPRH